MTEQAGGWQLPDTSGRARRRPESLVDYAVQAVRNELLTGLLRPGERLTEEATAQRLGISHIPVREAFRFLEAEGHVVRDARRGLRVAQLSAAEAQDIYRTRALLEAEANRLGVPELTADDDRRLAHNRGLLQALRDRDAERVNELMHDHRKWLLSTVHARSASLSGPPAGPGPGVGVHPHPDRRD